MDREVSMLQRVLLVLIVGLIASPSQADLTVEARAALRKAAGFFRDQVAVEGGYVYHYSPDLSQREGEGKAGTKRVWVQPPGTPAVGLAMLEAWRAAGEKSLLEGASEAARCLVKGQLHSGGWQSHIDLDPVERKELAYRIDGKPGKKARNISSFDDNQSSSAIRLLISVDQALDFKDEKIHEAAMFALDAVVKNQHACGGWSQVFDGSHLRDNPRKKAEYPADWPRTCPGGDYWWHYTFNDGAMSRVIEVMLDAAEIYKNDRYRQSALRAGQFILDAQMPPPQTGWAQQYNAEMNPAWARKFEPAAVGSLETVYVLRTLFKLHQATGDKKYLAPVPSALAWLKESRLSGGEEKYARFYELKTNRPLYMTRDYKLTYESDDLPTHYGFIRTDIQLARIQREYEMRLKGEKPIQPPVQAGQVQAILAAMDSRGAWVEPLPMRYYPKTTQSIRSETFIANIGILSRFLEAANK